MPHGLHAPGLCMDLPDVLRAAHNLLVSHGTAVKAIRAHAKQTATIGWAPVGSTRIPASTSGEDIEAARTDMFAVKDTLLWSNTWFADPVIFGKYPEDGLSLYGAAVPHYTAEEMKIINEPIDFYGANCYTGTYIRAGSSGEPELISHNPGIAMNMYHWPITFEVLRWTAKFFYERYKKPIVITENGIGGMDWVHADGKVHDSQRTDYTARHLAGLKQAIDEDVPVKGYFHWSLMDNFEWHEGYRQRFGLVYVDYATQKRILKDSAYWYKEVIRTHGAEI